MAAPYDRMDPGGYTMSAFSGTGPILRQGVKGSPVEALQKLLAEVGFPVAVDGAFGPETEQAVANFQRKTSLASDGVVGVQTWAMFAKALGRPVKVTGALYSMSSGAKAPGDGELTSTGDGFSLPVALGVVVGLGILFGFSKRGRK